MSQKVYGYRWVVLAVYALVTAVIEIQWLTFAPVAREARTFYNVSALQIDFLSLLFLGVFVVACIPASFVLDTYGIRIGIGIGAVLTGVFGLFKGFFGDSYTMVVLAQIMLAIGQPFIINAATKVAGLWFPIHERATAVGIATLAQFLGIIFVMIMTPILLTQSSLGMYQIPKMLKIYGVISAIGALVLLVFLREKPPTPPTIDTYKEKVLTVEGFKRIINHRDMKLLLLLFFIGLGIFNAISTVIDQICQIKNLTVDQTGMVGGMMLIAGILGALILPTLSDKLRKRKLFVVVAMVGMTPGLIGLAVFSDYTSLLVSSFVFGFFLLGAGAPVGFQYAAEITFPAPESSSQGLLLLVGQISGILFIVGMNYFGMIESMYVFMVLALVAIVLSSLLNESQLIKSD
jgi:MFS family permease